MSSTYSIKIKGGKKTKYYYYRCTCTYKKSWNACSTKQINADILENYIYNNLNRISLDQDYLENLSFKMQNSVGSKNPHDLGVAPLTMGIEPKDFYSKITPTHLGQTLINFIKELKDKKGIEKQITTKKYIKNIIYSREKIEVNIQLTTTCSSHHSSPRLRITSTDGERQTKFEDKDRTFQDHFQTKKIPKQQQVVSAHTKKSTP